MKRSLITAALLVSSMAFASATFALFGEADRGDATAGDSSSSGGSGPNGWHGKHGYNSDCNGKSDPEPSSFEPGRPDRSARGDQMRSDTGPNAHAYAAREGCPAGHDVGAVVGHGSTDMRAGGDETDPISERGFMGNH